MKKARVILACLALALALGGLTGCMLPDYQLETDITVTSADNSYGGWADVTYNLTNIGSKRLRNVQITLDVDRTPSTFTQQTTLGPFSINTGETVTGTKRVYFSSSTYNSYSFFVYITSVGWDADN
jgi:hypothetical protein